MRCLANCALLLVLAACGGGDPPVGPVVPDAYAIAFLGAPGSGSAGSVVANVSVELVDSSGNRVISATDSVRLALLVPVGSPAAAATGRLGRRAAAGQAAFDSVVVTTSGDGYRLVASAPGLAPDTSASFDVAPAAAAILEFDAAPQSGRTLVDLPGTHVSVRDAFGNLASATVSLALDSAPAGATLTGTTSSATTAGTASFSNLKISLPGARMRLTASAPGAAPVSTPPFDVGARLNFLDTVVTTTLGMLPSIRVAVTTDFGQVITGVSANVRMSIIGGLAAQPPQTAQNVVAAAGVATITTLRPARPGTGYSLVASALGLDSAVMTGLTVTWLPVETAPGGIHSCSRSADGLVACVGSNLGFVLGGGTTDTVELVPVLVRAPVMFASVSAGSSHTCALTATGQAYCWGTNGDGQLGIGIAGGFRDSAMQVTGGLVFRSIQPGSSHTCALTTDSLAYCWGLDQFGTLGSGVTGSTVAPTAVAGGRKYAALSTGVLHSCGITASGEVWCWGVNSSKQLGDGTSTNGVVPVRAQVGRTFMAVSAGIAHTCALDGAGKAWCWGADFQLGNPALGGSASGTDTAVAVSGGFSYVSIDAGAGGTCARIASGELYCWGQTFRGQMGNGSFGPQPQLQPVLVSGGLTWGSFSFWGEHVCGIAGLNELWCWGRDDYGQLGNGAPRVDANVPVRAIQ